MATTTKQVRAFRRYNISDPENWNRAKPGDLFGDYLVIARKLYPKSRAEVVAESVDGEVWRDGGSSWAVMKC